MLTQNQYGFQTRKATEHSLLLLSGNSWIEPLWASTSFDCLDQEILLVILEDYGVSSITVSCMMGNTQSVIITGNLANHGILR